MRVTDKGITPEEYEPPRVLDLGSLSDLTGGTGHGNRDNPANDGSGKT
jgi:hypothetical protein